MAEYKTPGVYVEEISTFPASVVRVATAVPVFVGYTELHPTEYQNKAVKVKSLVEYQRIFGGEPTTDGRTITVTIDANHAPSNVALDLDFYLYQSLRHYFANGGGDAYIMSVGAYGPSINSSTIKGAIMTGLANLDEYDEPTLILTPDAFGIDGSDLGMVQRECLEICAKMQDRFSILDVKADTTVLADANLFRSSVGEKNLKYGAAYFPPLKTTLGPDGEIAAGEIVLTGTSTDLTTLATNSGDDAIASFNQANTDLGSLPSRQDLADLQDDFATAAMVATNNQAKLTAITNVVKDAIDAIYGISAPSLTNSLLEDKVDELKAVAGPLEGLIFALYDLDTGFAFAPSGSTALGVILPAGYTDYTFPSAAGSLPAAYGVAPASVAVAVTNGIPAFQAIFDAVYQLLDDLLSYAENLASDALLYTTSSTMANIRQAIRNTGYTLPPSGAVAGAYAVTDANRGVWKAPANISLNAVSQVLKMTEDELNDLNVPGDGQGKSINAIRFFRGQGNLIYGARTLAGNDNEWRYVPVRRLFIMVEESLRKAIEPFVFESNDANTWIKVKAMTESFLNGIWRDGGLAGGKPEHAYYVKVGLGQTMTAQDILEGKLIVEIGMAAVRPAEFVVLKFSHLMQES